MTKEQGSSSKPSKQKFVINHSTEQGIGRLTPLEVKGMKDDTADYVLEVAQQQIAATIAAGEDLPTFTKDILKELERIGKEIEEKS